MIYEQTYSLTKQEFDNTLNMLNLAVRSGITSEFKYAVAYEERNVYIESVAKVDSFGKVYYCSYLRRLNDDVILCPQSIDSLLQTVKIEWNNDTFIMGVKVWQDGQSLT